MFSRIRFLAIANAMIIANLMAVMISLMIVILIYTQTSLVPSHVLELIWKVGRYTDTTFVILVSTLAIIYERPIRRALRAILTGKKVEEPLLSLAQRRLLNEPFFLIFIDFFLWVLIVLIILGINLNAGTDPHLAYLQAFKGVLDALVTITAAYFFLNWVLRRVLVPIFFPEGGLSDIPGVKRPRIRGRILVLAFAINMVPLTNIIILHYSSLYVSESGLDAANVLSDLSRVVIIESFVFIAAAFVLTLVVSGNLSKPFGDIIHVLHRVAKGFYNERVRVTTSDEIGYTGDVINRMTAGLKEREQIKDTFGRYVAKEVRDEVLSGRIPLDGEFKDVSVLFADIRDFTPMTEHNHPKMIVKIMNAYFKEMAAAVHAHGGLVLQFIGDEIYAVFGAPIRRRHHHERALKAGMEMNRRLQALNSTFKAKGYPQLRHGIGIHSGTVIAASIGSPDRQSYLLVGDTVNLASRLQALTKKFKTEMLISAQTYAHLRGADRGEAIFSEVGRTPIRGKTEEVEIFALRQKV